MFFSPLSLFSALLIGLCLSLNQTRKQRASNDCLATSNTCQTQNRAEDREKRRGPATIPRPSFTNYTEYLLTGGLSQCLLSHPTPLIFPLQHPITFHPALLQFTTCRWEEAPCTSRQTEETKEKEDKEGVEEDVGKFGLKTQALIWESFKSDKTEDEKVIRVKVRSWVIYCSLAGLVQQEFLRESCCQYFVKMKKTQQNDLDHNVTGRPQVIYQTTSKLYFYSVSPQHASLHCIVRALILYSLKLLS